MGDLEKRSKKEKGGWVVGLVFMTVNDLDGKEKMFRFAMTFFGVSPGSGASRLCADLDTGLTKIGAVVEDDYEGYLATF